jgi:hypothetical protein
VDTTLGIEIMGSQLGELEKAERLAELTNEELFELCSIRQMRQSQQPGERATLWPKRSRMIDYLASYKEVSIFSNCRTALISLLKGGFFRAIR